MKNLGWLKTVFLHAIHGLWPILFLTVVLFALHANWEFFLVFYGGYGMAFREGMTHRAGVRGWSNNRGGNNPGQRP